MEFLIIVSLLTLVFAALYQNITSKQVRFTEYQVHKQAEATADKIAYELDLALSEGEGYTRNFTVRDTVGGDSYSLKVKQGLVILEWMNTTVYSTTAVKNVSGEIEPGKNQIVNTGESIKVVG